MALARWQQAVGDRAGRDDGAASNAVQQAPSPKDRAVRWSTASTVGGDTQKPDGEAAHGGDDSKADADTACIYEQYNGLGGPTAGECASKQADPRTRGETRQKVR